MNDNTDGPKMAGIQITGENGYGYDFNSRDGTDSLYAGLWYPPMLDGHDALGNKRYIEIGLCAVRCANSIRVSYDFRRDGWLIEQPIPGHSTNHWVPVGFVGAWQTGDPGDHWDPKPGRIPTPDEREAEIDRLSKSTE